LLAPGASNTYRAAIAGTDAQIAYADDDLLDDAGRRIAPHFKPTWNSELFRHFDYLTGSCVIRTSTEDFAGLSGDGWMRQLTLLVAEQGTPVHVPHLLHHRRSRPRPQVPTAPEIKGKGLPLVSVIVPTRNRRELLRACLEGLERTDYPDLEVLVIDNDSDDPATLAYLGGLERKGYRVLHHAGTFNFSAINNRAAAQARGEILCLLNNDVEVIEPHWLPTMVTQALRDDVGAVGAQLLYSDGRIQHAGVVLGICGGGAHAHRLLRPNEEGYFQRHLLPQFVSAVTAACMVVRRDRFLAVGGFDERSFAVAFNDVDICMRLNKRGWQSLYEPRARLIHHESISRGKDREPAEAARFAGELTALRKLWGTDKRIDPFHHPELSPYSEQFVVAL
jgi:GT2 family glycosyltransferase